MDHSQESSMSSSDGHAAGEEGEKQPANDDVEMKRRKWRGGISMSLKVAERHERKESCEKGSNESKGGEGCRSGVSRARSNVSPHEVAEHHELKENCEKL